MALKAITDFKTCEECGGGCELIKCNANPKATEWYCAKCHRSYLAYESVEEPKMEATVNHRKAKA